MTIVRIGSDLSGGGTAGDVGKDRLSDDRKIRMLRITDLSPAGPIRRCRGTTLKSMRRRNQDMVRMMNCPRSQTDH